MLEDPKQPGAVLLGARTMQEGGAFLNMTREDVELFCIDHQVMVEITATDEALIFDFASTTAIPSPTHHTETSIQPSPSVTGIEGVMQVAHIILTDFEYEEDAFIRAKQSLHEQFDSTVRGLESACMEKLLNSMTNNDKRYVCYVCVCFVWFMFYVCMNVTVLHTMLTLLLLLLLYILDFCSLTTKQLTHWI